MNSRLLTDIERFLAESGMGEFRFGLAAVKNGRLVERLRSGGRVWPETEAQIRAFIISEQKAGLKHRPKRPRANQAEVAA
jgi:hypothetical protein